MNSGDADGDADTRRSPSMNTEIVAIIGEIVKQNAKVQFEKQFLRL